MRPPLAMVTLALCGLLPLGLCRAGSAAEGNAAAVPAASASPSATTPGGTSGLGRKYSLAQPLARGLEHGSLNYTARVVHNDRQYLSYVRGTLDLASGDFVEEITQSYILDFKVMPGKLQAAPQAMPSIWQVDGRPAQRFGSINDANSLPSFGSALLRHFVIAQVIGAPQSIRAGTCYIAQQLEIETVQLDDKGFEIVARYRGGPLVIVGSRQDIGGRKVPRDMAILGPTGELYQYFFEDFSYSPQAPEPAISLPQFNSADYVSFPAGEPQAVPIRPVKDWLVFQASLPSGRQLNLLLDSGADTMIVDDLVLELDAGLSAAGETTMEGAVASSRMKLYKGFSFNVGGVEFRNLPVVGGTITNIALGAGMRIHGVVGSEVLQLCRLDLDLDSGQMRLLPADNAGTPAGQPLPLTFINDFPHVEAEVAGRGKALMLLDTGQRSPVSVNLDALQDYKLDDSLVMDGFLGDIGGSLLPRYMLEKLDLTLGGQTFEEKTVDAAPEGTYHYNGVPVIGSIGFSLLARHFGGVTFDYRNKYLYLREPSQEREFKTSAEAWTAWQTKHYDPARLARKLAEETQQVGYALLRAEQEELISAEAGGKSLDPVEQILAAAGLPGPGAEQDGPAGGGLKNTTDQPSATPQADSPSAQPQPDAGSPAFRIDPQARSKTEPDPESKNSDSTQDSAAQDELSPDGDPEKAESPAQSEAVQKVAPAPKGQRLPPMKLRKTDRRFGRAASDVNSDQSGQGSSAELWGGIVTPSAAGVETETASASAEHWLHSLRNAASMMALAIRSALQLASRHGAVPDA